MWSPFYLHSPPTTGTSGKVPWDPLACQKHSGLSEAVKASERKKPPAFGGKDSAV